MIITILGGVDPEHVRAQNAAWRKGPAEVLAESSGRRYLRRASESQEEEHQVSKEENMVWSGVCA